MALEVAVAGELIDNIKAGIIQDECFGPIAHFLGKPSQRPQQHTRSAKVRKLRVSTQHSNLQENGPMWLHGELEKKEVEKNVRAKKNNGENE
jgi:hypothetical protein